MNIQTVNEALVSLDRYISANSSTLIFISIVVGLILFLIIFFLILKTNNTLRKQNKLLISKLENDSKNNKINRSLELINEFNSADFRIKVLSVIEIKLKMHDNDLGDNQSIVNDAEFRYALINCIHFFNNAGYLYLNDYLDNSIISNNLSSLSVELFDKLEPYFGSDTDKAVYWKQVNEYFKKAKVLNLDEEINPISEKALF